MMQSPSPQNLNPGYHFEVNRPALLKGLYKSWNIHERVEDEDIDMESNASGSDISVGASVCVRDERYCPSPLEVQEYGS
jgi:hypothetical protein